jgi:hypothetical protein
MCLGKLHHGLTWELKDQLLPTCFLRDGFHQQGDNSAATRNKRRPQKRAAHLNVPAGNWATLGPSFRCESALPNKENINEREAYCVSYSGN